MLRLMYILTMAYTTHALNGQVLSAGDVMEIPKAVCLHEEDAGVLWKHMDYRTGELLSHFSRQYKARYAIPGLCSPLILVDRNKVWTVQICFQITPQSTYVCI